MGATNHTTNYNLSQFIGTDKPSWLNDYNGDMSAIDTAIKASKDAADLAQTTAGNASTTATSASNTVSALNTQVNTPVTGLAAQVSDHGTAITGIENTIGTTPLTTVSQTLTGAIEEVKGSIPVTTGLLTYVSTNTITESYNGSKTVAQAMQAVYSSLASIFSTLADDEYIKIVSASYDSASTEDSPVGSAFLHSIPAQIFAYSVYISPTAAYLYFMKFSSSSNAREIHNNFTVNDHSSDTPASGEAHLTYERYKIAS